MTEEKKKTFKNKNIFDYLKNIIKDKDVDLYRKHVSEEGFAVDFKKFMVLRYLSMSTDERTRDVILENQMTLERMDEKNLYRFLISVIPQNNNHFIRYIR